MATENGINGYINYKVWQYLNKFKERHRQLTLRRYLIDGAKLAVHKYRIEHQDATYPELKDVAINEFERLRAMAEDRHPEGYFTYSYVTIRKFIEDTNERNAL